METRRMMGQQEKTSGGMVVMLVLLISASCFAGIFDHSLWTPDEPRVAEIGRQMLLTQDYVVPRLAGEPFLEKPPLYWWVQVASYRTLGVSPGAARLPSAVFAFATAILTFAMARRMAGAAAGLLAASVLVTFAGFASTHRILTDPALAFFVTLGYWCFQRAAFDPRGEDATHLRAPRWLLAFYGAAGLAFLSKGIVALVLLLGPVFIYLMFSRQRAALFHWVHVPGMALLAMLCLLWPILLYHRGGIDLLNGFVVDNVWNRFIGAGHGGHERPATFYLLKGPMVLLPWVVILPALYRTLWRERDSAGSVERGFVFMASVLPVGIVLLSLPATKRPLYLLPLLPTMAVAIGCWLARHPEGSWQDAWSRNGLRVLVGIAGLIAGSLALAGGVLVANRVGWSVDERIAVVTANSAAPYVGGVLILVGIGVVVGIAWAARHGKNRAWVAVCAFCAIWAVVNGTIYRLIEPAKDLRPAMAFLSSEGKLARAVGYRLDESSLGALGFYTNTVMANYQDTGELLNYLDQQPEARVLVLQRRARRLPPELLARVSRSDRFAVSGRRGYVLFQTGRMGSRGDGLAE